MAVESTQSGDIVNCFATNTPNRAIIITHYPDGTIVPDCEFLRCIYFDRCKLAKNNFVQNYLDTTDARRRGY